MQRLAAQNAHNLIKPESYDEKYAALLKKYEAARSKHEGYREEILEKKVRRERIEQFLDTLRRSRNLVTEFDEGMWNALVESLTVYSYARLVFTFKDGTKVEWRIK